MEFTAEKVKGVTVIKVPFEELDASNDGDFRLGIAPFMDKPKKLILDVSKMDFIDSSGLGAVLSCLKAVRANQGTLKIGGVSRNVRNVFELVHLYKLVEYFDTVEEALRRF